MQKKVIALAVASLLSGGAFAQSVNDGLVNAPGTTVVVSQDGLVLEPAGPNLNASPYTHLVG